MKTELLVQMEGCDPASTERRVLLVGATNRPEVGEGEGLFKRVDVWLGGVGRGVFGCGCVWVW